MGIFFASCLKASYGSPPASVPQRSLGLKNANRTEASDADYIWSVAEGVLPPGLTLDGTTEETTLSGTPTEPGIYTFTLQVIDRIFGNALTQQTYTVDITKADAAVELVGHYYETILGRAPDAEGQAYWVSEAERMQTLGGDIQEAFRVMAGQFFTSAEYHARQRSASEYVSDLYTTFFDRIPDDGGWAYWTGQLTTGLPRDVAMYYFLFSAEFATTMQSLFGDTATRAEINMVVDFYRGLLGRLPEDSGFVYWRDRFRTAQCQGAKAVTAAAEDFSRLFMNSEEYFNRHRTNQEYVADLYYALLRRSAELEGFNYWIDELTRDAVSRESLRQLFVSTPEFQGRVQEVISAGCYIGPVRGGL